MVELKNLVVAPNGWSTVIGRVYEDDNDNVCCTVIHRPLIGWVIQTSEQVGVEDSVEPVLLWDSDEVDMCDCAMIGDVLGLNEELFEILGPFTKFSEINIEERYDRKTDHLIRKYIERQGKEKKT